MYTYIPELLATIIWLYLPQMASTWGVFEGDLGFKRMTSLEMTKSTVYENSYYDNFNLDLCRAACDYSRFTGVVRTLLN